DRTPESSRAAGCHRGSQQTLPRKAACADMTRPLLLRGATLRASGWVRATRPARGGPTGVDFGLVAAPRVSGAFFRSRDPARGEFLTCGMLYGCDAVAPEARGLRGRAALDRAT